MYTVYSISSVFQHGNKCLTGTYDQSFRLMSNLQTFLMSEPPIDFFTPLINRLRLLIKMVGRKNNLFNDHAQEITPKRSTNTGNEEKEEGIEETFGTSSASSVFIANSSLEQQILPSNKV